MTTDNATAQDTALLDEDELKAREETLLAQMLAAAPSDAEETPRTGPMGSLRVKKVEAPIQPDVEAPPPAPEGTIGDTGESSSPLEDLARLKNHPAIERSPKIQKVRVEKSVPAVMVTQSTENGGKSPDISQKLVIAESQVTILSRELDTTRRSLRSAEERIDELSTLVRDNYRTGAQPRPNGARGLETSITDELLLETEDRSHTVPISGRDGTETNSAGRSRSSDVAVVAADRAALRIGPGRLESALFVMPKHTQLTIERRSGEWLRVVTPAGARGWVYGPSLIFGTTVANQSAVRIRAAQPINEPTGIRY